LFPNETPFLVIPQTKGYEPSLEGEVAVIEKTTIVLGGTSYGNATVCTPHMSGPFKVSAYPSAVVHVVLPVF
jgi:hypothetical protein